MNNRRWLLGHPISGPIVAKAPNDGIYGIEYGKSVWVVPESEVERLRTLLDEFDRYASQDPGYDGSPFEAKVRAELQKGN